MGQIPPETVKRIDGKMTPNGLTWLLLMVKIAIEIAGMIVRLNTNKGKEDEQ